MKTFKLRASQASKLLNKINSNILTKTAVSYLDEWIKSELYGVTKEIHTKYTLKGIETELEAAELACNYFGYSFNREMNTKQYEDEFFTGTPDIVLSDRVVDIKSSWDCFTFPLFKNELPNMEYFYQMQVYMHLTGKRKASVIYVLCNTPDILITNYSSASERLNYDNFCDALRIKKFDIDYCEQTIADLVNAVNASREYVKSCLKNINL